MSALADAGVVANDRQVALGDVAWERARPGEQGVILTLTEV